MDICCYMHSGRRQMKRIYRRIRILSLVLALTVILSGMGEVRAEEAVGTWLHTDSGWMFMYPDQTYATNTWIGRSYVDARGIRTRRLKSTKYEIPDYYLTQLHNTVRGVNRLDGDWSSFAIITDTHGDGQRTQNVLRYLLDHSKVSKCFWLGDLCDGNFDRTGKKEYMTFRQDLLSYRDRIYVTIGNHDRRSDKDYRKEDLGIVYRDFLKGKRELKGCPDDFYYYFDEPKTRLRYLVLNTSNSATNQRKMDRAELKWIRETALQLPGQDWSVVIFGHLDIDPNSDLPYKSRDSFLLTELIIASGVRVAGYFCGHEHMDAQSKVAGRFYQNVLTSDGIRKGQRDRVEGTVWDGAVTVVSVNSRSGKVIFHRIGMPTGGALKSYNYRSR